MKNLQDQSTKKNPLMLNRGEGRCVQMAFLTLLIYLSPVSFAQAQTLEDSLEQELDQEYEKNIDHSFSNSSNSEIGAEDDFIMDEGDDIEAPSENNSEQVAEEGDSAEDVLSIDDSVAQTQEKSVPEENLTDESVAGTEDLNPPSEPISVSEEGQNYQPLDRPNSAFENRLHKISESIHPIDDVKWNELIGQRKTEVYEIQSGDTLWDLSRTFFGDGFFWSKLWAENRNIENPHQIQKGRGIRFISGNAMAAPSIDIVSAEDVVTINALISRQPEYPPVFADDARTMINKEDVDNGLVESDELMAKPDMPPPDNKKPVLQHLPNSFKAADLEIKTKYDKSGIELGYRRALAKAAVLVPNSFIVEEVPNAIGKVEEIELSDKVASIGQNVFIKKDSSLNSDFQIGKKLSVMKKKGSIDKGWFGSYGVVMENEGQIEIVEAVNGEEGVYRAVVTFAVNPISRGSLVIDQPLLEASFTRQGDVRKDLDLKVIGGEFDVNRFVVGEHSVIYLEGGSKNGLAVGNLLTVRARRGDRKEDTELPDVTRPIALIKAVKVTEDLTTALVLESREEIRPGDRTGGSFPMVEKSLNAVSADSL